MIITHELYWKSCCTQCDVLVLVHGTISIVVLYCSNELSLCYNFVMIITHELYWKSCCTQCDVLVLVHGTISIVVLYCSNELSLCYGFVMCYHI